MSHTIDLTPLTDGGKVRVLSGKERGANARAHFGLDALDQQPGPVKVIVPPFLYALTASFFLGMFSPSVTALGGEAAFVRKYQFQAEPHVLQQVQRGLDFATADRQAYIAA